MDDIVRQHIFTSSTRLLRINKAIADMKEIVSNMNSPKQTKAKTKAELTKQLDEAQNEMVVISEQINNLSQNLYGSARKDDDGSKQTYR